MRVIQDNLWLCSDCTFVACNGERGAEFSVPIEDIRAGMEKLGPYLVPSFDSETGEGIRTFTDRICESCGSSLAGYRARFATLGSDALEVL